MSDTYILHFRCSYLTLNLQLYQYHMQRIFKNVRSKFETLLLNARLLTSHKIIMIHMKLSTNETLSGFTCKLHCMHVVVGRVVCVSGERGRWAPPPAAVAARSHATPATHRARARARRAATHPAAHRTPPPTHPILSSTIYYFDLYFMYRARTPGGKRFIC